MLRKGFFEIAGISRAIPRTEPRTVRKCIALQRAGKLHPQVSGPGPFFDRRMPENLENILAFYADTPFWIPAWTWATRSSGPPPRAPP